MQWPVIDLLKERLPAQMEATVCIVGTGPAGAFAAVDLAVAGYDVLLVEAGNDFPQTEPHGFIGNVDVSGAIDLRFGFARQIGGSSNLWAGRIACFDPIDFEERPWVPESGWPITRRELDPYYQRAAQILGLTETDEFFGGASSDPFVANWRAATRDSLDIKPFIIAEKPFRVFDYLMSKRDRVGSRLKILINATVTRLIEGTETNAVAFAEIAHPDGMRSLVRSRSFVLAAGGLESTRILLNSDSVLEGGIGNAGDNVGRYFSTHPKLDMAVLNLNKRVPLTSPLFMETKAGHARQRYGVALNAHKQRELKSLNHYVQLSPLFEYRGVRLFESLKESRTMGSALLNRSRRFRRALPALGLATFEALRRLAGAQRTAKRFVLRAFLDQFPNRENKISRSLLRDGLGMNKIDIRWRFSPQDRASLTAFLSETDRSLRCAGIGHIDLGWARSTEDWPLIGIHSHFMGTTRMGNSPRTAVVDRDCRVFGYRNLFISGPSTFPTFGFANPFLTISALSLRLAEQIASSMQKEELKS